MEDIDSARLNAQMGFLLAADGLKGVVRANTIADGTRRENSAEHSWHVALMAMVLAEHCPHPVNLARVVELLIVHDLVEVYAGDTNIYDAQAVLDQAENETQAASKLFALLHEDQGRYFMNSWLEFEHRTTAEACYARAIDAIAPTWLHWGSHTRVPAGDLAAEEIRAHKAELLAPYPTLMNLLDQVIANAVQRGLVAP